MSVTSNKVDYGQLPKLHGSITLASNYDAWRFRVKRLFRLEGHWILIEPPTEGTVPTESPLSVETKNENALHLLSLLIEDDQIRHIEDCETVKEAWCKLEKVHREIQVLRGTGVEGTK
jgi:hypothetical protein